MRSERTLVFGPLGLVLAAFLSCQARPAVEIPSFGEASVLKTATPPDPAGLKGLSGVYASDSDVLPGEEVVAHGTRSTLSIFTSEKVAQALLRPGCLDGGSRLVAEGHYRHARGTTTGLVRIELLPREAAEAVCLGDPARMPPSFRFEGVTGDGGDLPEERVTFTHRRALTASPERFVVAAHHGACRTIDECGISENSLESIRATESYGASVVEIDVRLTRDAVPVVFHDETLNPRLVAGPYCHGAVDEVPLAHIRANCTLQYGEAIPTLEEAIHTTIFETELRGLWLDLKTEDTVAPAAALVASAQKTAAAAGRDLTILLGLPEREIIDAYLRLPEELRVPCLVELETEDVRRAGCVAWGPRWTRGPMHEDVRQVQASGARVYFWTIDEVEYLDLFAGARPDGILTDRAGLLLHRYHTVYTRDGQWR